MLPFDSNRIIESIYAARLSILQPRHRQRTSGQDHPHRYLRYCKHLLYLPNPKQPNHWSKTNKDKQNAYYYFYYTVQLCFIDNKIPNKPNHYTYRYPSYYPQWTQLHNESAFSPDLGVYRCWLQQNCIKNTQSCSASDLVAPVQLDIGAGEEI